MMLAGFLLVFLGVFVAATDQNDSTQNWQVTVGFYLLSVGVVCLVFSVFGTF